MATKPNVLNKLAGIVAEAFAGLNTGALLDNVTGALNTQYKGADVPEADADFIADEVSRIRSWTATSAKSRKSEMRAIMSVYQTLPEAMTVLRSSKANTKPVTFEAGLKLARALKKGSTVKQAVAAYLEGGKSNVTAPADRDLAASLKSTATHINRVLEHTALPRKFRAALSALCIEHDIVL